MYVKTFVFLKNYINYTSNKQNFDTINKSCTSEIFNYVEKLIFNNNRLFRSKLCL